MKRAAVTLIVLGVIAVAAIWTGDNRWGETAGAVFILTICTAVLAVPVMEEGDQ